LEAFRKFKRFIYQGFIPVTKSIMVLTTVIFLLYYILQYFNFGWLNGFLILTPASVFRAPWTLITYPLLNLDPIALIFSLLWLWFIGGSLERIWGSGSFFGFVFSVTVVTGILMTTVGWFFLKGFVEILGLQLPLVAITWAWARIYPEREMSFFGIIPLRAEWLAWIYAAFTFFQYAKQPYNWLMGFASLGGILVVYLFRGKKSDWAGSQGFSLRSWLTKRRRDARKNKFKVIKH
jgi:membrane associated rhomboid family serine protease